MDVIKVYGMGESLGNGVGENIGKGKGRDVGGVGKG